MRLSVFDEAKGQPTNAAIPIGAVVAVAQALVDAWQSNQKSNWMDEVLANLDLIVQKLDLVIDLIIDLGTRMKGVVKAGHREAKNKEVFSAPDFSGQ